MSQPARGGSGREPQALGYQCPACGAKAGLWCRSLHSRALRRPPAPQLHVARDWAARRCPTCGEDTGLACVSPSGELSPQPHTARRHPTPGPREHLVALAPGPRAVHAALAGAGPMTATELALELHGPGARAARVTNQLVALRRRRLAAKDPSTQRWEAADA